MAYEPTWDGPIAGWATNYLRKNHWRVASWIEFEDLLQDARHKYLECERRYGKTAENGKHFMSLFKRCLTTHFADLSNAWTLERECILPPPEDPEMRELQISQIVGEIEHPGFLRATLHDPPAEVVELLWALELTPEIFHDRMLRFRRYRGKSIRETTNQWLCRLLGFDPDVTNVRATVIEYFSA